MDSQCPTPLSKIIACENENQSMIDTTVIDPKLNLKPPTQNQSAPRPGLSVARYSDLDLARRRPTECLGNPGESNPFQPNQTFETRSSDQIKVKNARFPSGTHRNQAHKNLNL
jgi:hypothetical protein